MIFNMKKEKRMQHIEKTLVDFTDLDNKFELNGNLILLKLEEYVEEAKMSGSIMLVEKIKSFQKSTIVAIGNHIYDHCGNLVDAHKIMKKGQEVKFYGGIGQIFEGLENGEECFYKYVLYTDIIWIGK